MQQERPHVRKRTLFDSDAIATQVASAVCRDMADHRQFDTDDGRSARHMLRKLQSDHILKRYVPTVLDHKLLERDAYRLFLSMNLHMEETNARLRAALSNQRPDMRLRNTDEVFFDRVLWSAKLLVKQVLGPFDMFEFFSSCKNGSGGSVGVTRRDACEESKFEYPISGTSSAISLSKLYLAKNFQLREAVEKLNGNSPNRTMYSEVRGSHGTTVFKDAKKDRFIAKEPTLNMFFQQGLMEMMYERLALYSLDVATLPTRHRQLAYKGSLDNSIGTIDSTSASDCVSYELVKWILPSDWFDALNFVRSSEVLLDSGDHGGPQWVTMNMFSSMGNAVTFPLETLLFWALGSATSHHFHSRSGLFVEYEEYNQVSVFGDDCVLPSDVCPMFCDIITKVGFIVNQDKSYYRQEYFRESCGGDYYHGMNVRPYSFKAPHSTRMSSLEPWLYTIINNLLPRYTSYFGGSLNVLGTELMSCMARLFRENNLRFKIVPSDYPDDSGLRTGGTSDFGTPMLSSFEAEYLLSDLGVSVEPRYSTKDGYTEFTYCHFIYKRQVRRFSALHYALSLTKRMRREVDWGDDFQYCRTRDKFFLGSALLSWARTIDKKPSRQALKKPDKRIGGYVVSKGRSSTWTG